MPAGDADPQQPVRKAFICASIRAAIQGGDENALLLPHYGGRSWAVADFGGNDRSQEIWHEGQD
jgi:hypothetical protein